MKDIIIKASLFGGSIELPLQRLDPFNSVFLSEFANRIAEVLQVQVLPENFRLRIGDALFSYDLSGSFLGENINVHRSANRISLSFKNGRVQSDLAVIAGCTDRFLEAFASGLGQVAFFSGFCHGACESQQARDAFLAQFAVSQSVVGPGLTGRIQVPDWPTPVKITSEASVIVTEGLFVGCEMSYINQQELKDAMQGPKAKISARAGPTFERAAAVFGLRLIFQ
jgi:hypothetical protein